MMNISKITKVLSLVLAAIAFVLVSGNSTQSLAQAGRDPFRSAPYSKPQAPRTNTPSNPSSSSGTATTKPEKPIKKGPMVVAAPPIESRIDYYKRVREEAATNGQPLPKVTSVLLVEEMSVTGIFKTPRGYAAMVEATPIKLSYTIYPGEKFFDGQLVAVEENRLIFRKVTKWSNNKFVSSVENKPLREYSLQQEIQGTSPATESYEPPRNADRNESANNNSNDPDAKTSSPVIVSSPLEEMNNQPAGDDKESAKGKSQLDKKGKKRASKTKKSS